MGRFITPIVIVNCEVQTVCFYRQKKLNQWQESAFLQGKTKSW